MPDVFEFLVSSGWSYVLILITFSLLVLSNIFESKVKKIAYIKQRNEDISRIGEGVAYGISSAFSNENFIKALRQNARVEIKINVDGSQNIIITGNNNDVDTA